MKHLYKVTFTAIAGILFLLIFGNASTGPGVNFSSGFTGAPFDGGAFCGTSCHSGGNFTPIVSIQLINQSNVPVTNYINGVAYTVRLTLSSSTGITATTRYGFQVVAVQGPSFTNSGTWGTLDPDHHSVPIGGRIYVEHSDRLTTNVIDIPWNAPATGTASVTFYAAGNIVDFSMDPTGDNANTSSLTIGNVLPVSWLYFQGRNEKNKVLLEWATTNEVDNGFFLLEKSQDGDNYSQLAKVNASKAPKPTEEYAYTDEYPSKDNYYRISQVDVNGSKNIFRTIRVQSESLTEGLTYVKGNNIVVMINGQQSGQVAAEIYSIDGRKMSSRQVALSSGTNTLHLERPVQKGIYIVSIKKGTKLTYSSKVLVE
jgi:hypothetical protein